MKKILFLFGFIGLVFLSACEKELEYTSDFNFKINEIDDTSIFINTVKPFNLEIIDLKNADYNDTYLFSYKVVSGGSLIVKEGTTTLIEDNQYSYQVDEFNQIHLDLIPQDAGVIKVEFTLKDNNNVEKKEEILVYCHDDDYTFTFTGAVPNPDAEVGNNIPFNLTLTNTGLSSNSFQLKYSSSGNGTLSIGGSTKPENTYFSVSEGLIGGFYNSLEYGTQTIIFTCKDISGTEISISLDFNFTASPFTLTKIADFSCKNTLQQNFQFTLSDIIASATYQIKFTSINSSNIYNNSTLISMGTWIPFSTDPSTLYTFTYEADSNTNDVLTVEIRDSYGQSQTLNYNVTIYAKPLINNQNIKFIRNTPVENSLSWVCSANTKSDVFYTISGGATLVETKIIIKNKITGNFDTLIFPGSQTINTLENLTSTCTLFNCNSNSVYVGAYNLSKYAGQLYSIQIKDSDGVWSEIITGTCLVL